MLGKGKKKLHKLWGEKNLKQMSAKKKRTCRDNPCAGKEPEVTEEQNRFPV